MDLQFLTEIFALAVYAIMFVKTISGPKEKTHQEKGFDVVLRCSGGFVVIDFICFLIFFNSANWYACEAAMCVIVALMPMLAMTWDCYAIGIVSIDRNQWAWRAITTLALPNIVYAATVLTNPFTGLYFTISPQMDFVAGPWFYPISMGFVMLYCFVGVALTLVYRSRVTPRSHIGVLLAAFAIIAVCFWVEVLVPGVLAVGAGSAVVFVLCDATIQEQRRRDLTEDLSRAVEVAEQANDAKTQFFARMSHDMRTPLNGILGLATIIRDKEKDPEIVGDIDQLTLSGKYLLHLINDTLDISKIESGQMTLHLQPTDPVSLASNLAANARTLADAGGVKLNMDLPDMSAVDHDLLFIDGPRLEQVLMNVISNAIKFTPEGSGVTLSFEGGPSGQGADKVHYTFTVADEGRGMDADFLPHLFESYSQEERTAKDVQGTGLGMSIVKQLIDLMDGTIDVQSELGVGTTITMNFDFERYDEAVPDTTTVDLSVLAGKRALLIEDHPINAQIAAELLKMKGMKTEWSNNGKKGVDTFNESEPGYYDAILMDIRMPVMNGLEAARAIRHLQRPDAEEIPIIAMTANAFEEDIKSTQEAGMNYHLAKPLEPDKLYAAIAEYVA